MEANYQKQPFSLEHWYINPNDLSVVADNQHPISLPQKSMEVLVCLAENYPRLVSRQQLIDEVWLGNAPVGEKSLSTAIWTLRKTFSDTKNQVELIETVRKTGYRLLSKPTFDAPIESKINSNDVKQSKIGLNQLALMLLSIIVVFLFFKSFWPNTHTDEHIEITRITNDPGRELFPQPSPDGSQLLYIWRKMDGNTNIYIKNLLKPELVAKQITFEEDSDFLATWDKTGKNIYFSRKKRHDRDCKISKLTLATMVEEELTQCPQSLMNLTLTADGQQLVYTAKKPNSIYFGLFTININTPTQEPYELYCETSCYYHNFVASYSPNGKMVAIARSTETLDENIFLRDLTTQQEIKLTSGVYAVKGITWHPSQEKIVFSAVEHGKRQGYVADIATKKMQKLAVVGLSYPVFIPKTDSVVFHDWQQKHHIAKLDLSDESLRSSFPVLQSDFDHIYPHYSAKKDMFVYVSNETGKYQLWTADYNGDNRKQLTDLDILIFYPKWSHDGEKIAFLGSDATGEGNNIYIYHIKNGRIDKLASPFKRHLRPTWSWNDEAITVAALHEDNYNLFTISLNGEESRQLTTLGAYYGEMNSPTSLMYSARDNKSLWQVNLDNLSEKQIVGSELFNTAYNWSLVNDKLYFQHNTKKANTINMLHLPTGEQTQMASFPIRTLSRGSSLNYIEKANQLVITKAEFPQIDIKKMSHPLLH